MMHFVCLATSTQCYWCTPWHQQLLQRRGVTSVASAGAGEYSHHIYSVGADTTVCTVDAVTGKLLQRFQAGKHALTCVKAASGMLFQPNTSSHCCRYVVLYTAKALLAC